MTKSHMYPANQVRDAVTSQWNRVSPTKDATTFTHTSQGPIEELKVAYDRQYNELIEYHGLLEDLATGIVASGQWQDYEGGMEGNGPIIRAYKKLGIPLPEEIKEWLFEHFSRGICK